MLPRTIYLVILRLDLSFSVRYILYLRVRLIRESQHNQLILNVNFQNYLQITIHRESIVLNVHLYFLLLIKSLQNLTLNSRTVYFCCDEYHPRLPPLLLLTRNLQNAAVRICDILIMQNIQQVRFMVFNATFNNISVRTYNKAGCLLI